MLVRHATTEAVRRAAFPADEPLDAAGTAAARDLTGRLRADDTWCARSRRTVQTARALGLDAVEAGALDDWDLGSWSGRTLADVLEAEPEAAAAWRRDAAAAPHGGESLERFAARVGGWLDVECARDGRAVAVADAPVIRAAVVRALGAPLDAFWRIDVAPLGLTELHGRDGRWTVARVNAQVPA